MTLLNGDEKVIESPGCLFFDGQDSFGTSPTATSGYPGNTAGCKVTRELEPLNMAIFQPRKVKYLEMKYLNTLVFNY